MPPIAVLAGGLATRLGGLTEKVPKSMLQVAGKPFIAHQLDLFRREGLRQVVLCTGHMSEVIENFVGDGHRFGIEVAYSVERGRLLGTGGALRNALPLLGSEFFVIYGDSYLDIAFRPVAEAFRRSGRRGLMTVFHNSGRWGPSNVACYGNKILAYSKKTASDMMHIDFGLSVLKASVLDDFAQDLAFDLEAVYRKLIETNDLAGYSVTQRFYEIGSVAGLFATENYILNHGSVGASS
jgi:NDP-sugar pyrophosphorylase family protein